MLKKIIIAILTGFILVFSAAIIAGICFSGIYNFVYMNAFWLNIEPRYILISLIILSLTISIVALIAIIDKE